MCREWGIDEGPYMLIEFSVYRIDSNCFNGSVFMFVILNKTMNLKSINIRI